MSEDGRESPCSGLDLPLDVCNDLQCPICLEFFKHPIILPCSHVLCRTPCADNLFDFSFIRCPVCRENCYVSGGLTSLPRVIALESIIDKYRTERRKAIQKASSSSSSTSNSTKGHKALRAAVNQHSGQSSPRNSVCASVNASSSSVLSAEHRSQRKHKPRYLGHDALSCSSRDDDVPLSPGSSVEGHCPRMSKSSCLASLPTPRTLDGWDASLLDVSTDSVTSCVRHGAGACAMYCHVCERGVCDVCGHVDHLSSHETNTLEEAAIRAKNKLSQNVEKLISSQLKVLNSLEHQRQRLKDMEQFFTRKGEEINMQCDSLLAEVEQKRGLFLADLEQEERMRRNEVEDVSDIFEKVLASSQSLALYTKDVLEKDAASVLQVTPALNDELLGSILDCEACQVQPRDHQLDLARGKVVDLRQEQAFLRDIHYLKPPAIPTIDLARCARSESTVALFLVPHRTSDVIDTFVIRYCSEEQKSLGLEETATFHCNHRSEHLSAGGVVDVAVGGGSAATPGTGAGAGASSPSYVALLGPLLSGANYLFCVTAANRAGDSGNSQAVQCVTLSPRQSVVPVPVILGAMCKAYSTSIRVFTPSPRDVAPEQSISHFLLYRPRDRNSLWRCVALCGRQEHRVFGLDPETQHEFVVMATNPRGECQLSEKLVLETEGV